MVSLMGGLKGTHLGSLLLVSFFLFFGLEEEVLDEEGVECAVDFSFEGVEAAADAVGAVDADLGFCFGVGRGGAEKVA